MRFGVLGMSLNRIRSVSSISVGAFPVFYGMGSDGFDYVAGSTVEFSWSRLSDVFMF